MFDDNVSRDATTNVELAGDAHPLGFTDLNEMVEDLVGRGFVIDFDVAVGLEVDFQGFKFNNPVTGDVFDDDGGEVRLTRLFGTKASEFRSNDI